MQRKSRPTSPRARRRRNFSSPNKAIGTPRSFAHCSRCPSFCSPFEGDRLGQGVEARRHRCARREFLERVSDHRGVVFRRQRGGARLTQSSGGGHDAGARRRHHGPRRRKSCERRDAGADCARGDRGRHRDRPSGRGLDAQPRGRSRGPHQHQGGRAARQSLETNGTVKLIQQSQDTQNRIIADHEARVRVLESASRNNPLRN